MRILLLVPLLLLLNGCFQAHSSDDLRAVPVTNNPNIVPNAGQGGQLPGAAY